MDEITGTSWQRMGSSIVFDRWCLGPLVTAGSYVSLRQALAWLKCIPAEPPVPGRTIVVYGLETLVELYTPSDSEQFLATRIRPLIIALQGRWTGCGLVFAFSSHRKAFEETSAAEEVLFRRRDQQLVRLSDGLWDGGAGMNMRQLIVEGQEEAQNRVVGYHVARIS